MLRILPTFYKKHPRQATWLELFFDLVFVAVIGFVTHDLAHTHNNHLSIEQLLRFPFVFVPMWWIWVTHTLYFNRFDTDSHNHKVITFIIMGMIIFLSIFLEDSLTKYYIYFVSTYFIVRLLMSYLYLQAYKQHKIAVFAKQVSFVTIIGASISLISILIPNLLFRFTIFYLGIFIDIMSQGHIYGKCRDKFPVDKNHLVERIGLLALIILGESIISMVNNLSNIDFKNIYQIIGSVSAFTMIGLIWWIYFLGIEKLEKFKDMKSGYILILTHLIFYMGLIILANLIQHTIKHDIDMSSFRLLAITGLISFYIGQQTNFFHAFPPLRKISMFNTTVCILITIVSTFFSRPEYALLGMTIGMLFYVYINLKWARKIDVSKYLDEPL